MMLSLFLKVLIVLVVSPRDKLNYRLLSPDTVKKRKKQMKGRATIIKRHKVWTPLLSLKTLGCKEHFHEDRTLLCSFPLFSHGCFFMPLSNHHQQDWETKKKILKILHTANSRPTTIISHDISTILLPFSFKLQVFLCWFYCLTEGCINYHLMGSRFFFCLSSSCWHPCWWKVSFHNHVCWRSWKAKCGSARERRPREQHPPQPKTDRHTLAVQGVGRILWLELGRKTESTNHAHKKLETRM